MKLSLKNLIAELRSRYPLVESLKGTFEEDGAEETIPLFFAFLMAAATNHSPGVNCLVVDKTEGTTAIAGVLVALTELQHQFPNLVEGYARSGLSKGQRVRVKPSDYIYEYTGVWPKYPDLFKLKVMDEETYRSFPIDDILRLEPTERLRPKGYGTSNLGCFELSGLDQLLTVATGGNNSLLDNTVLLYMPAARFKRILNEVKLSNDDTSTAISLHEALPWGTILANGKLQPSDQYQVAGQPLIAVTNVIENLALACASIPTRRVILADGARGVARDLQPLDEISDRQNITVIASREEADAVDVLRRRGASVWYLTPEEILIDSSLRSTTSTSFLGGSLRSAQIQKDYSLEVVDCINIELQGAADSLIQAAKDIEREQAENADELIPPLFRLLFICSENVFGGKLNLERTLQDLDQRFEQFSRWYPRNVIVSLSDARSRLSNYIFSGAYCESKSDALLAHIEKSGPTCVVLTTTKSTKQSITDYLRELGSGVDVLQLNELGHHPRTTSGIFLTWPNKKRIAQLESRSILSNIKLLAYPFEKVWISSYQSRLRNLNLRNRQDIQTRTRLTQLDGKAFSALNLAIDLPRDEPNAPLTELDERVNRYVDFPSGHSSDDPSQRESSTELKEARKVQFFGDCHAALSQWTSVPKLNAIIDGTNSASKKLEWARLENLHADDYVMFKSSGEHELIRILAEDTLGIDEYERIRFQAESWKNGLRNLGGRVIDIQRKLARRGLHRSDATIRNWLFGPNLIAPLNGGDIDVIADLTNNRDVIDNLNEVRNAISTIRSAHISAGNQITNLLLDELRNRSVLFSDQPVLLDLDFGSVWVVRVDFIDTHAKNYPINSIGKLIWTDDSQL